MIRTRLQAIVALAGVASLLAAGRPSLGDVLFRDDFNGALSSAWQIVRPDANYVALASDHLDLRTSNTDLYLGTNTAKNVFLIDTPTTGDFVVTMHVAFSPPNVHASHLTLLAYDNDDNYVRVGYGFVDWRRFLFEAREVGGTQWTGPPNYTTPADFGTGAFYLRMAKVGNVYSAFYSVDGVNFSPASTPMAFGDGSPAKLGFVAMADWTESGHALIDSFEVTGTVPCNTVSLFRDDFNGSASARWQVTRPDSSYVAQAADHLDLRTSNTDLYLGTNTAKNVYLIDTPTDGDFTATMRVAFAPPNVHASSVMLLAYDDDDNYVRAAYGFVDYTRLVAEATEVGGTVWTGPPNYTTPVDFGTGFFYLRMAKEGNVYRVSYSTDGTTFVPASVPMTFGDGSPAKLGFSAMADSTESAHALIDWFEVTGCGTADTTPPTTTATVDGPAGTNGWLLRPAVVTLTPTDDTDAPADLRTSYTVDGGGVQSYSGPFELADGEHVLSYWSVDTKGNTESPQTTTVKVDGTPPAVEWGAPNPAPNAYGWNNTAVSIPWTATDAASGVAGPGPSGSVTVSAQGAGQKGTVTVTDAAGNTAIYESPAVNIDTEAPTITITAPTGVVLLNQALTPAYTTHDALSGVDPSTVGVGGADTSTVGAKSVTVTAADFAGNVGTASGAYAVAYGVTPLYDESKAHKSGSTAPIKVRLVDAAGANLSAAEVMLHATLTTRISGTPTGLLDDSGGANPDYDFRYDAALGGYIFNLSLKGYDQGIYVLHFRAGADPTDHTVEFQVR